MKEETKNNKLSINIRCNIMNAKARILIFALFMAGMLGFGNIELLAAAITSAQSGNWTDGSTWVGGVPPTNADDVTIAAGHTITVNTTAEANTLTLNADATNGSVIRPDLSPSRTISVTGNVTVNNNGVRQGQILYNNSTGRLSWTLEDTDLTINTNGATNADEQAAVSFYNLTINGTTTVDEGFAVYGDFTTTAAGNFTQSTDGEVLFTNTTQKTITNNGALTFYSVQLSTSTDVTSPSDFIIAENLNIASGAELSTTSFSTMTISGGILTVAGDLTIGTDATIAIAGATTVNGNIDDMSGAMTLAGAQLTLGSSEISGTGSFQGASGATLSLQNASGVAGALQTSTVSLNAATSYIFTAGTSVTGLAGVSVTAMTALTVQGTVTTDESFTVNGAITVSGAGIFTASDGTITTGASANIDNSGGADTDLTFYNLTVDGTTVTSTIINDGIQVAGNITIGADDVLDMNGQDITITGTSTITNNNTFTIDGNINITGASSNVTLGSNLAITAGGTITLNNASASLDTETFTISTSAAAAPELLLTAGTVIIGNTTGLNAAIDLDANTQMTIGASVNFTFDGACTDLGFEYDAGEVTNAGGSDGTNITSIGNLTIGGTSAVTLFGTGAALTLTGNLTVNSGASFDNDDANDAEDFIMSGTATITNSGTLAMQALTVSGTVTTTSSFSLGDILTVTGSLIASSPSTITNTNITGGAIVSPENTAGTLTFYNVIFNGANPFTPGANGDYTVANDFTLAAASAAYTPSAAGADVTMSGTGATIEADGDNLTFGELTVSGTVTADDVITFRDSGILEVSGTFTMSTDALTFLTTAGTINGAGTLNCQNLVCGDALAVAGNLDINMAGNISGTSFSHTGSGDFTYSGTAAQTQSVTTYAPNSVVIPSTADVNFTTATANTNTPNIDLDGIWDVDAAANIAGGTLDIASTATIEFGVAGGASTTIAGAGTITASSEASYIFDAAGATGLIGLTSNVSIDGGGATNNLNSIGNVTFGAAITSAETFTVNGNVSLTGGNTFAASAGTITLAGTTKTIDNDAATADLTFFSLTVSGSYSFDATSNAGFDVGDGTNGIFTNSGSFDGTGQPVLIESTDAAAIVNSGASTDLIFGTLNYNQTNANSTASSFYINEAFNINAAFTASAGTIFFGGTATVTSAAAHTYNNLTVTAAGNATFADGTNGPTISDSLTVDGTIDVNGTADADRVTIDGGVISGTGTINLNGLVTSTAAVTTTSDITIDGPLATLTEALNTATAFTASSPSTITIAATGANAFLDAGATCTFFNLVVTGAATANDANYTITGDLTVNSGASFASTAGVATFDGSTDKSITNNGTLTFFELDIANVADNNVTTTSSFGIAGTTGSDFNIIGTTGGTFSATNGTITFSGAAGGITNGSDVGSRAQFNNLTFTGATNSITTGDAIQATGDLTFGASNDFGHGVNATSRITLNGTSQQTITMNTNTGTLADVDLHNVTLNNSNGARMLGTDAAILENALLITGRMVLTSGDFDLNGNNVVTFDVANNARLQETAGNTVVNSGIPSSTGYLAAGNAGGSNLINNNIGGLGARLSTDADPGAVTVRRYHKPATVGGQESISRYYRITAVNSSLNSTLTLGYDESELGSATETDLLVFNSADVTDGGANPWVNRISTQDTDNNSFRTRSIGGYADSTVFWAIAAPNVVTATEVTGTTKGISASPLTASRDSVVLYGLKLVPSGGEVTLDQLAFSFSRALNAATAEFSNYKLFASEDNDFTTTSDNTFVATTNTGGGTGNTTLTMDLTTNATLTEGVDYHYFLVADVASNVTASTTAITVSADNFGITVIDGVVKTYSEAGTAYSFIPGYFLDYISNGVSDSPIVAGQADNVIFGFAVDATSAANFTGFELDFSGDVDNLLENAKVYVSTDASYTTTGDNSLITMASTPAFSGDSIVFTFNTAQPINTTDKYYFVVADAKGGVDELSASFTPMLLHDDLTTSTAQPTYRIVNNPSDIFASEVEGQSYDFVRNTVTVSLTNDGINPVPPTSGNVSAGVINQTLLGFTLTSDNEVAASFTGVTAHVTFASGASSADFRDWKLWSDANGNGYGDSGEQIAIGTLDASVSEGNLTFSSFSTAQTVSTSSKYIVTAEVRSTATAGGTVSVEIPSTAYVMMTSPATVNDGGPFVGSTQTIRTPGAASQLAIVGNHDLSVVTGGTVTFTVQARDASGYPTNVSSTTTAVMSLGNDDGGESSIGGTVTGTISNGRSYTTVSPSLTDTDGSIVTTVLASDQAASLSASSASSAITILTATPTTDASALTLGAGSTPTTQIEVTGWTAGNGSGRIIVARANKIPQAPTDGIDYIPVIDLKNGYNAVNQTGPGSYVVYDGSGAAASFTVSGLTPDTKYFFAVYEYNGSNGVINYKDITFASDNPVSRTTTAGSFGTIADSTSAAIIETDVDITGTISTSGDTDWYQFNVPSDKNNVMVRLTNLPANYTIELYDRTTGNLQDMTLIRVGEATSTGNETMILNAADAGRYILKIYGDDSNQYSTSSYTVRVVTSSTQLYSLPSGN